MSYKIKVLGAQHKTAVVDIFNHYTENSYATYFENPVPYEFFDAFLQSCKGGVALGAEDASSNLIGFALLRRYHPGDAMKSTGELTYFIGPEHTGQGLGKMLLDRLIESALELGMNNLIASVSSLNEQSLQFHLRNDFEKVGCLEAVGHKRGRKFDVVLFQRFLK